MKQQIKKLFALSMKTGLVYFVFIVSLFALPFYSEYKNGTSLFAQSLRGEKKAVISTQYIKINVADTPKERIKGLSGTKELPPNEGLLFIFDNEDFYPIWMKDMNYPIDIIWLDSGLEIVHIEEKVSPDTYPKSFAPDQKALYILEVSSGFVETHKITEGQLLIIF